MTRAIAFLMAGGLLLAAPALAQRHPDLSGRWVLKDAPEAPDSTEETADSAAPGVRSDLRPVLKRAGKPEDRQELSRLVAMAQPVVGFRITQSDTAVTFRNDDGFTYLVRPGRGADSVQVGDEWIWMRARWRGRALEVEVRPPGDGRIIETYELADSGLFLRIEVVVEHDILAQRLWRPRMYRLETPE